MFHALKSCFIKKSNKFVFLSSLAIYLKNRINKYNTLCNIEPLIHESANTMFFLCLALNTL